MQWLLFSNIMIEMKLVLPKGIYNFEKAEIIKQLKGDLSVNNLAYEFGMRDTIIYYKIK